MRPAELQQAYLSSFPEWEKTALSKDPFWLRETREKALAHFGEIGFPSAKEERWQYLSLQPLYDMAFGFTGDKPEKAVVKEALRSQGFDTENAHLMVFVNGHLSKELSSLKKLPEDAKIVSLIDNLAFGPLKHHFNHILPFEGRPFLSLNYAYFTDGLFLHLPKGVKLDRTLHAVYLSTNSVQPSQSHLRNLLLLEEGAEASVVEHYWGNNFKPYFNNTLTKAALGEGARLDHVKVQQESPMATHVGVFAASQASGSRLSARAYCEGGGLSRNGLESRFEGKGAECSLEGLALAKGRQQTSFRTFVDHAVPSCASSQSFKSVVGGEALSVFDGQVLVRENAQKTDAKQSNKNLQLTKESKVYSKPQLQIYADDVKCSHGSATGQIDEEALFYFRSRGIGFEEARRTLVYAFAGEMVDRAPEALRGPLKSMVQEWMAAGRSGAQ